jgi:hypothetical protein
VSGNRFRSPTCVGRKYLASALPLFDRDAAAIPHRHQHRTPFCDRLASVSIGSRSHCSKIVRPREIGFSELAAASTRFPFGTEYNVPSNCLMICSLLAGEYGPWGVEGR